MAEVRVAIDEGHYARAEARARAVVEALERSADASPSTLADAVLLLAESLRYSDRVLGDEALATAGRAVELATAIPNHDRERIAASLLNLGHLHYIRDAHADARLALESSLDADTSGSDTPPSRAGITLSLLASLTFDQNGKRSDADALFERARAVQDATLEPTHPDVGFRHLLQGNVAYEASDYAMARDEYERAIEIFLGVLRPGHPLIARALSNLGNPLQGLGDYVGARRCLRDALAMRIEAYGPQHRNVGSTHSNLARLELILNNYGEAREHWERALAIETRAGGTRSVKCMAYLRGIGDCLSADKRFTEAAHAYEQALAIVEERHGRDAPESTRVLLSLAIARQGARDFEASADVLERVEHMLAAGDESDLDDRATLVMLQARLDLERGAPLEGRARLATALESVSATYGDDAYMIDVLLDELARTETALGNFDAASEDAIRAESIARKRLLDTSRMLREHAYLLYGDRRTGYLNRALQLALKTRNASSIELTWDALVRSRGIVFEETAERSRMARESTDPEMTQVARRLEAARSELARLTVRSAAGLSPEEFRAQIASARAAKQLAEEELAELGSELRERSRRHELGLAQVFDSLPAGSTLVAYVLCAPDDTDPFYLAFSSPASRRAPIVKRLGDAREIDDLVSRTLAAARNPAAVDEYRALAGRLRELIWDPLASELNGSREIVVVPDGALSVVNFDALPVGESAFLAESAALIRIVGTERDLARNDAPTAGRGLLALGGPTFDARTPLLAQADVTPKDERAHARSSAAPLPASYAALSFRALPGSVAEVATVESLWRDSMPAACASDEIDDEIVLLTGDDATEANFKRSAPGRRVLHLATHGFFVSNEQAQPSAGMRGVSAVRPGPTAAAPLPLQPSEDPLLLSGLAFAGANHRSDAQDSVDDGILTAEEIVSLDLSSVDCAVLSACDTGLGEIASGEGIFGLRRAFQLAGVRSLVVSLWPVDDDTTSTWMSALYRAGLAEGVDTAIAVRAASLETLEARRRRGESLHPYYWCAFLAIGSIRDPHAQPSGVDATLDSTAGK